MNFKVRMKNPWFWVSLFGVMLTASGVDPQTFTSWTAVLEGIAAVLANPVQIGGVVLAVLGVFVDPTTSGITDSARAMTYTRPNND